MPNRADEVALWREVGVLVSTIVSLVAYVDCFDISPRISPASLFSFSFFDLLFAPAKRRGEISEWKLHLTGHPLLLWWDPDLGGKLVAEKKPRSG